MQIPGSPSLAFLLYLFLFLPWMAYKSRRKIRVRQNAAQETTFSDTDLEKIWYGTILQLAILFILAWQVGAGFHYSIAVLPSAGFSTIAETLSALAVCLLIRALVRRTTTETERRSMVVFALAPRSRRQWLLKAIVVLCASVAEEAAYRGVCWQILSYSTGHYQFAALLSSAAFALAHWIQGWKSMFFIFIFAIIMHTLVWYTQSLITAMLVHAAYDCIAITLIAIEAARFRKSSREGDPGKSQCPG